MVTETSGPILLLVCSNFEWLNGIFLAVVLLLNDLVSIRDGDAPDVPTHTASHLVWPSFHFGSVSVDIQSAALIFAITGILLIRVYYSILQWKMLAPYHYKLDRPIRRLLPLVALFLLNLSLAVIYAFFYFMWFAMAMGVAD
jgi:hypothetical protein